MSQLWFIIYCYWWCCPCSLRVFSTKKLLFFSPLCIKERSKCQGNDAVWLCTYPAFKNMHSCVSICYRSCLQQKNRVMLAQWWFSISLYLYGLIEVFWEKKKQSMRHNWIFSAINLSIWLFMNVHLVLWSISQYHPSFYCSNCSILGHEDPLKEALFACHVFQLCVNTPIFMALPVVLSALCSPRTSPVTNHFCKVTCNFV